MRRLILLTVGLSLIGGILAGCSGSADKEDPMPKGPPPETKDAPKGAVPPGDGGHGEG